MAGVPEAEARQMMCCGGEECGERHNTTADLYVKRYCGASKCMAWRWVNQNPHEEPKKGSILLPRELWPGYCGLAGPVRDHEKGEPNHG